MIKREIVMFVVVLFCACIGAEIRAAIIDLGSAESFAVLGGSAVTNTGSSVVWGDLGVSPAAGITGFLPGIVNGTTYINDAYSIQAQADASSAYTVLAGLSATQDLTGQNLGGLTLTPGVYSFSSSAALTGILTLDGQGLENPQFIFQIGSTLTTASASSVVLINGANAYDIYFQVGSSATLGTGTEFVGTIISDQSNTLTTGANVLGRVIALNAAVTLDSNEITICEIPEPATVSLLCLGGLALIRRRRTA